MRRRADTSAPAAHVTVFDGHGYLTEAAWKAAYSKFLVARAVWSQEHDGAQLPALAVDGC